MKVIVIEKTFKEVDIPFIDILNKILIEVRTWGDNLDLYSNYKDGYVTRFASIKQKHFSENDLTWILQECDTYKREDKQRLIKILNEYEEYLEELSMPEFSSYSVEY